jgi:hypothetical protein
MKINCILKSDLHYSFVRLFLLTSVLFLVTVDSQLSVGGSTGKTKIKKLIYKICCQS